MTFTPAQFQHWRGRFTSYYNSSKMSELSLPDQQSYLFQNIDETIHDHVITHINDQTPLFGDDGCMQLILDEFTRAYPLIKRRISFFQCKEESSQNYADYLAKLNTLSAEADLQNLTMDDLYKLQLLVGTKDTRLTKELITTQNMNKDEFFKNALTLHESYHTATGLKETILVQPITLEHAIRVIRENGKSSNKATNNSTNKVTRTSLPLPRTKTRNVHTVMQPHPVTSARLKMPLATCARRKAIMAKFVAPATTKIAIAMLQLPLHRNDYLGMCTSHMLHDHIHECTSTNLVQMQISTLMPYLIQVHRRL